MIHPILAATLIATQAAAAAPAPPRCMTREEAGDVAAAVVPVAINAMAERCRPHVAADAFLNTGAHAMLARMRQAAESRRSSAFAALARVMPSPPAPPADGGGEGAADGGDEGAAGAGAPDSDGAGAGQARRTSPEAPPPWRVSSQ